MWSDTTNTVSCKNCLLFNRTYNTQRSILQRYDMKYTFYITQFFWQENLYMLCFWVTSKILKNVSLKCWVLSCDLFNFPSFVCTYTYLQHARVQSYQHPDRSINFGSTTKKKQNTQSIFNPLIIKKWTLLFSRTWKVVFI